MGLEGANTCVYSMNVHKSHCSAQSQQLLRKLQELHFGKQKDRSVNQMLAFSVFFC